MDEVGAGAEGPIDRLIAQLTEVFSMLSAGEARFVTLVGQLDQLEGWADGRTRSCAHWLNWKLGITMPAARERVRVARALRDLPALAGAFADGRLSYSKVRAITRVATPGTEATLLGFGLYATAAQLERICRTWRQVRAAAEPNAEERQRQTQRFDLDLQEDGMLGVAASLPTDVGVLLARALAKASTQLFAGGGSAGEGEDRRIEALRAICESFLAGASEAGPSSADIWQVVVHADADALAVAAADGGHPGDGDGVGGAADGVADGAAGRAGGRAAEGMSGGADLEADGADGAPDDVADRMPEGVADAGHAAPNTMTVRTVGGPTDHGLGQVEDGPVLARSVLARLACDTTLVGQVSRSVGDGGPRQPLGIGRRHRTIPGWLRRLVHQRDPGCQFPGCPNTTWTDVHHVIHWADGGPTDLDNLVRLCRFHHTSVHRLGLGISRSTDDRSWTFTTAAGDRIEPPVLPSARSGLPSGRGLQMWEGDPARMRLIIDALVQAAGGDDDVSAGTSDGSAGSPDPDDQAAAHDLVLSAA